jgi:hypothetical protein
MSIEMDAMVATFSAAAVMTAATTRVKWVWLGACVVGGVIVAGKL